MYEIILITTLVILLFLSYSLLYCRKCEKYDNIANDPYYSYRIYASNPYDYTIFNKYPYNYKPNEYYQKFNTYFPYDQEYGTLTW